MEQATESPRREVTGRWDRLGSWLSTGPGRVSLGVVVVIVGATATALWWPRDTVVEQTAGVATVGSTVPDRLPQPDQPALSTTAPPTTIQPTTIQPTTIQPTTASTESATSTDSTTESATSTESITESTTSAETATPTESTESTPESSVPAPSSSLGSSSGGGAAAPAAAAAGPPSTDTPNRPPDPLAVVATTPEPNAIAVDPEGGFRLQLTRPLDQDRIADIAVTVTADGAATGHTVLSGSLGTDLTGQSLTFVLSEPLNPKTRYRVTVAGLWSEDGQTTAPVVLEFTTRVRTTASGIFTPQRIADLPGATTVAVGPDGHLYATSFFGTLTRYELSDRGVPTGRSEVLLSRQDRHFLGFDFEPGNPDAVWVSQWAAAPTDAFSTEVSRYRLSAGVGSEQKRLTGLPRHPSGDHSVQSIRFKGSTLYLTVGSATTGGARSLRSWGEPILGETPITAAIVEVDWANLGSGVDTSAIAITEDTSPVRLFATGLRNPYDLVWHSNGNLYANINQNGGLGQGDSGAPTEGPCAGLPEYVDSHLISDTLNLVKRGRYYGHPNPSRGECVVMGGGQGRFAVGGYGPDQAPDPDFDQRLILSYGNTAAGSGISVNGIDEYRAGGPLEGRLLAADSAGSHAILAVDITNSGTALTIDRPIEKLSDRDGDAITFVHPLDVAAHPFGPIAVADFGGWSGSDFGQGGAIHLLKPAFD